MNGTIMLSERTVQALEVLDRYANGIEDDLTARAASAANMASCNTELRFGGTPLQEFRRGQLHGKVLALVEIRTVVESARTARTETAKMFASDDGYLHLCDLLGEALEDVAAEPFEPPTDDSQSAVAFASGRRSEFVKVITGADERLVCRDYQHDKHQKDNKPIGVIFAEQAEAQARAKELVAYLEGHGINTPTPMVNP